MFYLKDLDKFAVVEGTKEIKKKYFEKCDKLTDVKVLSDFEGSEERIGGKQINKNGIERIDQRYA